MSVIKKLIFIISIFPILLFSQEQKKETVYLLFDTNSIDTYTFETGDGKVTSRAVYIKENKKYKNINFYIGKELFTFNKKKNEIDTCTIKHLKNIKISKIEDLKKIVNKINPLYPFKVFEKLYLVEKINDSTIVKYDVKWEYYIE